jgi:hypothetical protein
MTIRGTIIKTRPSIEVNWYNTGVAEELDIHCGSAGLLANSSRTISEDELTVTLIEEYNSIEDLLAYNAPTLAAVEWLENNVDPYPATVGITISRVVVDTESNYEYTQEEINSLINAHVGRT